MNNLELINKLYKPYKITKKGKCTIISSTSGKYVIKEKGENIKETYNYLKSREFYSYPKLVDYSRNNINIFEYKENFNYPKEQRAEDLIDVIVDLHSKTLFSKEVRPEVFKRIYENIENNLNYYKYYYENLLKKFEEDIFPSPSHYLFLRNYSKLMSQIDFCFDKLNDWYELVKDKTSTKVCQIHNNLRLDHLIKDDEIYLISWDKSKIDSPVLDLYNFYKNEALNLEFSSLLNKYLDNYILDVNDKFLLLLMICLPIDINFTNNEFDSCKNLTNVLDYIYKTELLVRPYYSDEKN